MTQAYNQARGKGSMPYWTVERSKCANIRPGRSSLDEQQDAMHRSLLQKAQALPLLAATAGSRHELIPNYPTDVLRPRSLWTARRK